ncbi:MAG: hypothetical protein COB04_06095 [Gammaproteobacteria bacterium]|nr:MAG: hypothetical protein COB04_06095 [Gammaproteobacteria bacterium]
MLVCICNRISDRDIRHVIRGGANCFSDVRAELGFGSCCGKCVPYAKEVINDTVSQLQIIPLNQSVST